MAAKPLTDIQKLVLSEIIRNQASSPRIIAQRTQTKLVHVLKALLALRQKHYIAHSAPPAQFGGNAATYRALKTCCGCSIEPFHEIDRDQKVAEYLRSHKIEKVPPGRAAGITKSGYWDQEL